MLAIVVRATAAAAEGISVASAACVALAMAVLASYVARAYAGAVAGAWRAVASLLPVPVSRFDDAVDGLAALAASAESAWAAYIAMLSIHGSQETASRASAIVTCLAAAYALSFVHTGVLFGIAVAVVMTVPAAIHHDLIGKLQRHQRSRDMHAKLS